MNIHIYTSHQRQTNEVSERDRHRMKKEPNLPTSDYGLINVRERDRSRVEEEIEGKKKSNAQDG